MSGISDFLNELANNPRQDIVERTRAARYNDQTPEVGIGDFPSNMGKGIYGLSLGLTSDPVEQAKIIGNLAKSNPNIKVRERYGDGRPMINIGNESYHMNKPGASALRAVKRPMSRALVAGLATGATQTGKEIISEDLGGTFDTEMIAIAAASGMFGQGVLEGMGKLMSLVSKNKGQGRIFRETDTGVEFTDAVKKRLEAEGIDPNQFSEDSIRKLDNIIRHEPRKIDDITAKQAQSDITLSRTEAQPKVADVVRQNEMMGNKAARVLNEHEIKQLDEIDDLISSLGNTNYLKKYAKTDQNRDAAKAYREIIEKTNAMADERAQKEVYEELGKNRDMFRNSMKEMVDDAFLSFDNKLKYGDDSAYSFGIGRAISVLNNKSFPDNYRKMLSDKMIESLKKNAANMSDTDRRGMLIGLFNRRGSDINSRQSLIDTADNINFQLDKHEKIIRSMYPDKDYGDFVIYKLDKLAKDLQKIKLSKTKNVKRNDKQIMMVLNSFTEPDAPKKYPDMSNRWQKTSPIIMSALTGLTTGASAAMIPGFPAFAIFLSGLVGAGAGRKMIPDMIKKNITHPRQMKGMIEDTSPVWNRANVPGGEMIRTPIRASTYAGIDDLTQLPLNQEQ